MVFSSQKNWEKLPFTRFENHHFDNCFQNWSKLSAFHHEISQKNRIWLTYLFLEIQSWWWARYVKLKPPPHLEIFNFESCSKLIQSFSVLPCVVHEIIQKNKFGRPTLFVEFKVLMVTQGATIEKPNMPTKAYHAICSNFPIMNDVPDSLCLLYMLYIIPKFQRYNMHNS